MRHPQKKKKNSVKSSCIASNALYKQNKWEGATANHIKMNSKR